MKVLEKGRPQKGWSKEYVCTGKGNREGGCGARLLVEFLDLFRTYHTDMTGDRETRLTFKCSECGVLTDISVNDPPNFELIPDRDVWEARQTAGLSSILHG